MRVPRWTGIDHFATEFVTITRFDERWHIDGCLITAFDGQPAFAEYSLICDESWETRHVSAKCRHRDQTRSITLQRDLHGWSVDGALQPWLAGCIDIDLEVTPFTNSLPINRLKLSVGQHASVDAVWIRFPELSVEVLPQRYTRVTETGYHYETGDAFQALLTVDKDGIVVVYENGWEQPHLSRD